MPQPIPPPPPPPGRSGSTLLLVLGGIIAILLIALIVIVASDDGSQQAVVSSSTAVATTAGSSPAASSSTTPVATTSVSGTTSPAPSAGFADLDDSAFVIADGAGVGVVRDGLTVERVWDDPAQVAMADHLVPQSILIVPRDPDVPVSEYPRLSGQGGTRLIRFQADGSSDTIYEGTGKLELFDIAYVEGSGFSAILVETEELDDAPFRRADIVVVPYFEGNPVVRIENVTSGGSAITGLGWFDRQEVFMASVTVEGTDYILGWDIDGQEVTIPGNPEPFTRDYDTQISHLTRQDDLGNGEAVYVETFADGRSELAAFDHTNGYYESVPLFGAGRMVTYVHASGDRVVVSSVQDDGSGSAWPYTQQSVVFFDNFLERVADAPDTFFGIVTLEP